MNNLLDWGLFGGQHFCVRCPVGRSTPGCNDCKPDLRAKSCKPCPGGRFLPSKSDTGCIECSAGKWQSKPGTESCHNCPAGTFTPLAGTPLSFVQLVVLVMFSHSGQEGCYTCRAGEFQPSTGQTVCKKCPLCDAGKFVSAIYCVVFFSQINYYLGHFQGRRCRLLRMQLQPMPNGQVQSARFHRMLRLPTRSVLDFQFRGGGEVRVLSDWLLPGRRIGTAEHHVV